MPRGGEFLVSGGPQMYRRLILVVDSFGLKFVLLIEGSILDTSYEVKE
jgi:hypothetical protein